MPFPGLGLGGSDGGISTLALQVSPSLGADSEPHLQIEWETQPPPNDTVRLQIEEAVNAGREGGTDLVAIVQRIQQALSSRRSS